MSEPTDLIRAVDEVHKPIRPKFFDEGELVCEDCGDLWPCEVRRLRDALVDEREHRMELRAILGQIERKESHETCKLLQDGYKEERDEARAALAEANATIERVKALADDGQTVGWVERDGDVAWIAADAIRRAIEGPAT